MIGGGLSTIDDAHVIQSETILLEPSTLSAALSDLWHQRLLCDIILRTTTVSDIRAPDSTEAQSAPSRSQPAHSSRSAPEPGPGSSLCSSGRTAGRVPRSLDPSVSHHQHQCPSHSHGDAPLSDCCRPETAPMGANDSTGQAHASADANVDMDKAEVETVWSVSVVAVAGDVSEAGGCDAGGGGGALEEVGEVEDLPAHRVVLAATCDYFRALLVGAGAAMNDMATAAAAGAAAAAAAAAENSIPAVPLSVQAAAVVSLPGLDGWALRLSVGALYERRVEIAPDNLEGLLSAASYLGATALLDACAAFMRSTLRLQTCLPLLLLAWRYNMGALREELMSYVCRRFSLLVRTRLSSHDARAGGPGSGPGPDLRLSSLPLELLVEVLQSEELLVECESDVLQCSLEWLAEREPQEWPNRSAVSNNSNVNTSYSNRRGLSNSNGDSDSSQGDIRAAAALELVRLVHWESVPDPPHLHLTRGSPGAQTRALGDLLEAHAMEMETKASSLSSSSSSKPGSTTERNGVCIPPAVLRLRRLVMELKSTVRADLAPYGVDEAETSLSQGPGPEEFAAGASRHEGGISDALRRIGSVIMTGSAGGSGRFDTSSGCRPRRHLSSCLLASGGHDASWRAVKAVEVYDPRKDRWVVGPSLLQGLSFTGAAMVPGSGSALGLGLEPGSGIKSSYGAVFLVGGTPLCSSVWRLPWGRDGPVGRVWEPCPPLLMPRAHAGVVSLAGTVTVLGGRSQVQQVQHVLSTVEVLVPSGRSDCGGGSAPGFLPASGVGCWRLGPEMVLPRSAHACAVLGGRIFALGGAGGSAASGGGGGGGGGAAGGLRGGAPGGGGSGGSTHRSGEVLDLGSGRWQLLGCDMSTERKYTAAAAHGGRIYVAGGVKDSRTRLSSLEALDPREGKWTTLEPMSAPRSSHSMAALCGCLYVAGGQCNSVDLVAAGGPHGGSAATACAANTVIGAAWNRTPPGRQPPGLPQPFYLAGSLGGLGSSSPTFPYGPLSSLGNGLYGSAPGAGGSWSAAVAGLGFGFPAGGATAVTVGGGSGEDVTVLSGMECYDVTAGRWRQCASLSHGGRAGLALCAV